MATVDPVDVAAPEAPDERRTARRGASCLMPLLTLAMPVVALVVVETTAVDRAHRVDAIPSAALAAAAWFVLPVVLFFQKSKKRWAKLIPLGIAIGALVLTVFLIRPQAPTGSKRLPTAAEATAQLVARYGPILDGFGVQWTAGAATVETCTDKFGRNRGAAVGSVTLELDRALSSDERSQLTAASTPFEADRYGQPIPRFLRDGRVEVLTPCLRTN